MLDIMVTRICKNNLSSRMVDLLPLLFFRRKRKVQVPTRIPEKIVIALFSGILVNSGIPVVAMILETIVSK